MLVGKTCHKVRLGVVIMLWYGMLWYGMYDCGLVTVVL